MKPVRSLLALMLVGVVGATARSADQPGQPLDKDFLIQAATADNAAIQITKLAEKHASSPAVKEFALSLQKDHKAAYDKLGELLKTRKVGVAAGFEKETTDDINRLSALQGKEFDQAFLDYMIKDHKKAIKMFENEARSGQEADIREYARGLLPDLRKHLSKAEELAKSQEK